MQIRILPLEEAIKLEAKQNIERDYRVFGFDYGDALTEDQLTTIYENVARLHLMEDGVGYSPEYDDHVLVKVEQNS